MARHSGYVMNSISLGVACRADATKVARQVIRTAEREATRVTPRRGDPRPGKSEDLASKNKGWHTTGKGTYSANFFLTNSASYAKYRLLGRGPVSAKAGGKLTFPVSAAGPFISKGRVRAARGRNWLGSGMRSALRIHGLSGSRQTYFE